MNVESLVVIIAALLIGTIGKAVTGFGLPLIAIPVMAAFINVETAVVVMVFPSTLSNIWLLREFRGSAARIERLPFAIACGLVGVALGTWLLKTLDHRILALVLAGWIGVYLLMQTVGAKLDFSGTQQRLMLPFVVGIGGVTQGATGIAGPIVVTYLHAFKLDRGLMVFVVSAIFLSYGITQITSMVALHLLTWERLIAGLVAMIPVIVGMPLGLRLGRKMNPRTFNICVYVLLGLTGLKLVWDGVGGFL